MTTAAAATGLTDVATVTPPPPVPPITTPLPNGLTYDAGNQPTCFFFPFACNSPSHHPVWVFFRTCINCPISNDNCSGPVAVYDATACTISCFFAFDFLVGLGESVIDSDSLR